MGARERFVQATLRFEWELMMKNQSEAIKRKLKLKSGHILSARNIVVQEGEGMDGRLTYTHAIYERFLDMKKKDKVRKVRSRKIHNRFIFGAYASIAKRLMHGFTEETATLFRSAADNLK